MILRNIRMSRIQEVSFQASINTYAVGKFIFDEASLSFRALSRSFSEIYQSGTLPVKYKIPRSRFIDVKKLPSRGFLPKGQSF